LYEQSASTKDTQFHFLPQNDGATATLADLIEALNEEITKKNGELITSRSLKRSLDFLKHSIGVELSSKDQRVPVSLLKTIRLLFLTDYESSRNVLRLLASPEAEDDASMEFSTMTTTPRDEQASSLIQALSESLSLEIDRSRMQSLFQLLGHRDSHSVSERVLLHFERTNDEVSQILHGALGNDEGLMMSAFCSLSAHMEQFRVKLMSEDAPPANEAMYIYLQALPFRHFIQHYPKHFEATRVRTEIGSISDEAERFCRMVAYGAQHHHGPASRVFSVNTFHHLLREHPKEICELVQKATSIPTTVRHLQGHRGRVKALLMSYAYRSLDCTDPGDTVLSVYDVVAALCSFRYQQESGDDYKPYWHGQTDQGRNPQRLFDKGLSAEQPYLHQGVAQIYLNRLYEYRAAFSGTIGGYHAEMNYQAAVLGAYLSVLDLQDITAITTGLNTLNFYCVNLAKDLVIDHYRMNR